MSRHLKVLRMAQQATCPEAKRILTLFLTDRAIETIQDRDDF